MIKNVQIKVYLEGNRISVSSVSVRRGQDCVASIKVTDSSRYWQKLKPSTIVHIFFYDNNKWNLLFVGKSISIFFDPSGADINFISLDSELERAYITTGKGFDLDEKMSYTMLYGAKKPDDKEPLELVSIPGLSSLYDSDKLKQFGSLTKYIEKIFESASITNPWFKLQNELFKLASSFYILDNPNVIELFTLLAAEETVKHGQSQSAVIQTYAYLLSSILDKLYYTHHKLGTYLKTDQGYKSNFILPNSSFLSPYEETDIDETLAVTITKNLDKFSRILIRPNMVNEMGDLKNQTLRYLYTFPSDAYDVDGKSYNIAFSDQEKISGINPFIYSISSTDLFLQILKSKKDNLLGSSFIREGKDKLEAIAEFKFYDTNSAKNEFLGLTLASSYNIFSFFPIKFKGLDMTACVNSIILTIDAAGNFDTAVSLSKVVDSEVQKKKLPWYPDEYNNIDSLYEKFRGFSYISEDEYWKLMGIKTLKGTSYKKLDGEKIIKAESVKKEFNITMFCEERAAVVREIINDK